MNHGPVAVMTIPDSMTEREKGACGTRRRKVAEVEFFPAMSSIWATLSLARNPGQWPMLAGHPHGFGDD